MAAEKDKNNKAGSKKIKVKSYTRRGKGFGDSASRRSSNSTQSSRSSTGKSASSHKTNRVPSGIPGFDSLIEGGFVEGSVNLLIGDAGTGKSIFGMQYIMNGITSYGENGVYITFEEDKESVYQRMKQFGWNLGDFEKKGKFAFLEYTPEQVEKVIESGGGIVSDVVMGIKGKRIVIDSITAFTLLFAADIDKREALQTLFDLIKKWKCTALLIADQSEDLTQHKAIIEEFEVDSDMITYTLFKNQERQRFIEVFKMRGTNHSKKLNKFDITKRGVIIKDAR